MYDIFVCKQTKVIRVTIYDSNIYDFIKRLCYLNDRVLVLI